MSEAIWQRAGGGSTLGPQTRAEQAARQDADAVHRPSCKCKRCRQDRNDSTRRLRFMVETGVSAQRYDSGRGRRRLPTPPFADSRGPDGKPLWPPGTLGRHEWLEQLLEDVELVVA